MLNSPPRLLTVPGLMAVALGAPLPQCTDGLQYWTDACPNPIDALPIRPAAFISLALWRGHFQHRFTPPALQMFDVEQLPCERIGMVLPV